MTLRLLLFLGLAFTFPAGPHASILSAADSMEAELAELRGIYEDSAKRALEPLRKRHIEALEAFVRRASRAGDLDAAVKGRAELNRFRAEAGMMENPFIGQWEYRIGDRTYRRIIRENGSVELWRDGKVWLKADGKPYWVDFTWKSIGKKKLELRKPDGSLVAEWEIETDGDPNTIVQRSAGETKKVVYRRAKIPWTR